MRFLCKDCWLTYDPAELLAGCKRCEANTRIARLEPLQSKASSPSAVPLVCRLHPAVPLDVYCPACERAIAPRAVVGDRSVIGLLGDTASGKTSYLWVLSERLRQPNDDGVFIRQALGDSDEQMAKAVRGILKDGGMSATPATDAVVRNFAWEVSIGPHTNVVIAFHDAAGELWNDLDTLSQREYDRFYRYFGLMGAAIFTVDGARLIEAVDAQGRQGVATPEARAAQSHEIAIIDTVSRFVRAKGVRIPVAVVVTKADLFWDRPEWELFQERSAADRESVAGATRELLLKGGRRALVSALEETFAPVRFFTVSAFGREQRVPLIVENLMPARVDEPLMALLGVHAAR